MDISLITTGNDLQGYKVVKHLGVIRGITVRSRSVVGNFAGGIQSLFGGRLSVYVELCENARQEAYHLMIQHAQAIGANAIIGMRYDANEVMQGITEVLAYGTAVVVEKVAE
ncbi:YbjQ family protein [Mucilaginibacter sp.]|uniref:YbjQ family protein n=1 Tax=Mucilaginibacter sp. TaxID=1882438 RepID=UPI0035BC15EE